MYGNHGTLFFHFSGNESNDVNCCEEIRMISVYCQLIILSIMNPL